MPGAPAAEQSREASCLSLCVPASLCRAAGSSQTAAKFPCASQVRPAILAEVVGLRRQFRLSMSSTAAVRRFGEAKQEKGSFYAFHGSPLHNWHSILRSSLRNCSSTTLMSSGAVRDRSPAAADLLCVMCSALTCFAVAFLPEQRFDGDPNESKERTKASLGRSCCVMRHQSDLMHRPHAGMPTWFLLPLPLVAPASLATCCPCLPPLQLQRSMLSCSLRKCSSSVLMISGAVRDCPAARRCLCPSCLPAWLSIKCSALRDCSATA